MITEQQWSRDIISVDPHTLVPLSNVSSIVNEFFHLEGDDLVRYETPFVWWDRSKRNTDIAHPMPAPAMTMAGGSRQTPVWFQEQIVHWFGQWRGLPVPECVEAGDKVSRRGHLVPSQCRVVS